MNDILQSLNSHIAQMAPHQKDRRGGKLLIAARDEIERLREILSAPGSLRLHVDRAFPDYAWESREYIGRLRAAAEELERRLTIERGETPSP